MSFERILNEMKNTPVLWKSSEANYRNRLVRAKLWKNLACKIGVKEDLLKKRWKHLKDHYRKELKKMPDLESENNSYWISSWKYFECMEFMKNEVLPDVYSNGNLNSIKIEVDVDVPPPPEEDFNKNMDSSELVDPLFVTTSPSQSPEVAASSSSSIVSQPSFCVKTELDGISHVRHRKKRLNQKGNGGVVKLRSDADYLYLRSILPSMKQLTDYQKLVFRGRINEWLLEALNPMQETNSSNLHQSYYTNTETD